MELIRWTQVRDSGSNNALIDCGPESILRPAAFLETKP